MKGPSTLVVDQWIKTAITAELVRGAIELDAIPEGVRPHRLPAWARAQSDFPQLMLAEAQTSGVRVSFRTSATAIELETRPTKLRYAGLPPRTDGVYDLLIDGELFTQATVDGGNTLFVDIRTMTPELQTGAPGVAHFADLREGVKDVEIWLPHNEATELLGLRTNAPVEPLPSRRRVWLHHGSSISHGSDAAHPTGIWPAVAALAAEVELINLGFGGNALLDQFTARVIRDTPADVISIKVGINVVNHDAMRLRAFGPAVHGFLDTIREGHPTTPLLLVSPILCPMHEDTPGPSKPDIDALKEGRVRFVADGDPADIPSGKLTLGVIRDQLARIAHQRAATDSNLHYLDGRTLYGEADLADLPLPDDLHPDADAHRLMGERFAAFAFAESGALA